MNENSLNIILVGPMGAGKTTIGRLLAIRLKVPFMDSDREIEARTGANIAWIFDVEGEEGFRQRESKMIDELTRNRPLVLATGGGAILSEDNRRYMTGRGKVVYLLTSIEQQLERTNWDRNRPLLQTENPRARLEELMAIRDPLYREIADMLVDTDTRSPKSVSEEIARILEQQNGPVGGG